MQESKWRLWVVAIAATLITSATGERRRPRAGLWIATPTNPEGGWSFDLGVNDGRQRNSLHA